MKTTNNKCFLATVFPMGCFIFFLLNFSLDHRSVYAADFEYYRNYIPINSMIFSTVDSSITNFLLADYFFNDNQIESEKELQLESWMNQPDDFQYADATDSYDHSLYEDLELSYESWMSEPEVFISQFTSDPVGGKVQSEEEIRLENWMINTSSWIDIPCNQ